MRQVKHIFIREFSEYFISPIAYIVISIFLLITGWLFFSSFFLSNQAALGDIDWGPVIGGYIGAILLAAAFSSIGLFASSLTRNQIIAFIIGLVICFFLTLIDKMLFFFPSSIVGFLQYIAAGYHFENISKGIIDSRDIIYFLSISFLGLYGSHLILQEKY